MTDKTVKSIPDATKLHYIAIRNEIGREKIDCNPDSKHTLVTKISHLNRKPLKDC